MKTLPNGCGLLFFIFFVSFCAHTSLAAPVKMTLDLNKSHVSWAGKFMSVDVRAHMDFKSGEFLLKKNKVKSAVLVADMNSLVSDSGLEDGAKGAMLLNVEKYPTATLTITEFEDIHAFAPGGPNARASGTFLFRGKSYPVHADFVMAKDKSGFHVVGTFKTVYSNMVDGVVTYEVWAKR